MKTDPLRVLIIEDDSITSKVLLETFLDYDFETQLVTDVEQALAALRSMLPDVLIIDLDLPHADGLALLKAIRADGHIGHTPIFAVIPHVDSVAAAQALHQGFDACFPKPIEQQTEAILDHIFTLQAS